MHLSDFTYFCIGSTAIPLGLTKSRLIKTDRNVELSKLATSIVSFAESVQYNLRPIQSTATPAYRIKFYGPQYFVLNAITLPSGDMMFSLMNGFLSVPSYFALKIAFADISLQ